MAAVKRKKLGFERRKEKEKPIKIGGEELFGVG